MNAPRPVLLCVEWLLQGRTFRTLSLRFRGHRCPKILRGFALSPTFPFVLGSAYYPADPVFLVWERNAALSCGIYVQTACWGVEVGRRGSPLKTPGNVCQLDRPFPLYLDCCQFPLRAPSHRLPDSGKS